MKTRFTLLGIFCALFLTLNAQVTTDPAFITIGYTGEVTIIYNPSAGNGGMKDAKQCWAHTGVNQWSHTQGEWRKYDEKCRLTKNDDGNWELKITPDINTWYGVSDGEVVSRLCFVFNDGPNGSLEGKDANGGDIFVDLVEAGLRAKIEEPAAGSLYEVGEKVSIKAVASEEADLMLTMGDKELKKVEKATEIEYEYECTEAGTITFQFTATTAESEKTASVSIEVIAKTQEAKRPEGIDMGIYYDPKDNTKVTLSTYAASKTEHAKAVFVVGEMNNWQISEDYQMKRDGNYFWIELTGLTPQREYAFQYVVIRADGVQKRISDLYSEKLLHSDDRYEPTKVDTNIKPYPAGANGGYVTVVQTDKPKFQWSDATLNFQRPDKNNLVIYELWVYDYTAEHSIAGVTSRLDYLQSLGVNAIELMPICEFDGNLNWGYSPNHYFAPDRAYGNETQYKTFIDECHKRGIAVIMDMVFNHGTGQNPMNMLYPYGADLVNNPWFCVNDSVPHGDNVYEHWNHDFEPARQMFTRALQYWLREYHVDGYRMDLSHGLCGCGTQKTYDYQKLMNNLSHYYQNGVKAVAEDAYFILEHWGPNMGNQRPKLVQEGMMCWENTNNAYSQTAMGWLKDGDSFASANKDGYVSYVESHDEERNFYKAKTWGQDPIKNDETVRLNRVPVNIAFNVLLNGPHMLWQYSELGYDYSINSTRGSNTISDGNRTSSKVRPDEVGWFESGLRMNQYQKVGQVIRLRTELAPEVFEGNPVQVNIGSGKAMREILWGTPNEDAIYIVGNFSHDEKVTATLPDGKWYNYFEGNKKKKSTVTLKPGELYIYTAKKFALPDVPATFEVPNGIEDILIDGLPCYVYPTITKDIIHIEGADIVQVFNLNGQRVMSATGVTSMNLSNLDSGLYIIRLLRGNQFRTMKVIKE